MKNHGYYNLTAVKNFKQVLLQFAGCQIYFYYNTNK